MARERLLQLLFKPHSNIGNDVTYFVSDVSAASRTLPVICGRYFNGEPCFGSRVLLLIEEPMSLFSDRL